MNKGEILIDVKALKGKSIMVATPMYGGMGNTMYISSLLQLQDKCHQLGIKMEHCFMMNESLIDRGRNGLVHEYLTQSKADFLLFIDADIQFRPDDIFAMMSYDKEFICAPYPKKHINWPVIIEAIKLGTTDINTIEQLVGEYVFTPLEPETKVAEIIKVSESGTGLMLLKRSVFEKMKVAFPENYYESDHSRDLSSGKKKEMHAFFRTGIFDNRYLSEDYYFCHKWREIGGDVWLFPWAITAHFGAYPFAGSLGVFMDTLTKIQHSRKKEGKVNECP